MAVSDLNGHDRPPHSACTLRHLPREAVPPEVPDGVVLFPPAPGVVPMYFVWEVGGFRPLPYKLYRVFPICFVWQTFVHFQKWTMETELSLWKLSLYPGSLSARGFAV